MNQIQDDFVEEYLESILPLGQLLDSPNYAKDPYLSNLKNIATPNYFHSNPTLFMKMEESLMQKSDISINLQMIAMIVLSGTYIYLHKKNEALIISNHALKIYEQKAHQQLVSAIYLIKAYAEMTLEGVIKQFDKEINQCIKAGVNYFRLSIRYLRILCTNGLNYLKDKKAGLTPEFYQTTSKKFIELMKFMNDFEVYDTEKLISYDSNLYQNELQGALYYLFKNNNLPKNLNQDKLLTHDILMSTYHLKKGDCHLALTTIKNSNALHLLPVVSSNFARYTQIRGELVSNNYEAAMQLMTDKINVGDTHYMDDLFYFRIELLLKNKDKANFYFNRCIENCQKHQAIGRLQLELELSYEINAGDLFEIMHLKDKKHTLDANHNNEKTKNINLAKTGVERLVGSSQAINHVKEQLFLLCDQADTILITGETGVGKEECAKALHEESTNKDQPFLAINCGAITHSLLQSELFGYVKGAFTGANKNHNGIFIEAGEGVVLLDEIGTISETLQVALLRILENREVRPIGSSKAYDIKCKIYAATNEKLSDLVKKNKFREDLYYRLAKFEIKMPSLKDRNVDILPLVDYFFRKYRNYSPPPKLSESLQNALVSYPWPGNIRQLKNEIDKVDLLNSRKSFYELQDFTLLTSHHDSNVDKNNENRMDDYSTTRKVTSWRRLDSIKEEFVRHKDLTRLEVANLLNISLPTASSDLNKLIKEGFIIKIEPSKSPRSHYFKLKE